MLSLFSANKNVIPINIDNFYQDFGDLGVSKFRKPVAPQFKTFDSRLKTFFNWKSHDIQTPEKLAEAGFYYIGYEDKVLCFHCGGGLKNWEKAEEPWVEHARWFSKCYFVILEKGNDFVRNVLKKKAVSENVCFTKSHPPWVKKKKRFKDPSIFFNNCIALSGGNGKYGDVNRTFQS